MLVVYTKATEHAIKVATLKYLPELSFSLLHKGTDTIYTTTAVENLEYKGNASLCSSIIPTVTIRSKALNRLNYLSGRDLD